jgi:hypothetical protein
MKFSEEDVFMVSLLVIEFFSGSCLLRGERERERKREREKGDKWKKRKEERKRN